MGFKDFLSKNRWAILLTLAVIVTVLLFWLFGWWMFLIIPLVGLAIFFGHLLDKGGKDAVKDFFAKLFSKGN